MVFSSLTFICLFLPAVAILNAAIPQVKARNILLIVASLAFYAFGEPIYVLLMLASTVVNYSLGRVISTFAVRASKVRAKVDKQGWQRKKKQALALSLIFNLGALVVFKYAGLLADGMGLLLNTSSAFNPLPLPLGISFYTFQAISFVVDTYRGKIKEQKSYLDVLLYISFFPQLIAGPIVRFEDIAQQIKQRKLTLSGTALGLRRFCVGLAKKVILANSLGYIADNIYALAPSELTLPLAWLAAGSYMLQIYFDFSGYSDMAIGLARMLGFHFNENFNYPFISRSIKEFWRRWHISLSSWFRDYLYIPLGGNRKGKARTALNKLIVFALCGLWHGATPVFLVWGLFHGLFLLLEDYVPIKKLPKFLGWIYAIFVVMIGFVIFRSENFAQAGVMLGTMFNFVSASAISNTVLVQLAPILNISTALLIALAALAALPLQQIGATISAKFPKLNAGNKGAHVLARSHAAQLASYACAFVLLLVAINIIMVSDYNPFIYFRF